MPRSFCIPGVFFLLSATVLLIIVSVSLPFLPDVDITRVHFTGNQPNSPIANGPMQELKFGIWAFCTENDSGDRTCNDDRAYSVIVQAPNGGNAIRIASSWTRGLAIHPVAAGVSFLALVFGLSTHLTLTLLSSLLAFLAALITLIAFAVDIALLAFVKHEMGNLLIPSNTNAGPGFWFVFASLIALLLGACTVCFGRRRDRAGGKFAANDYAMTQRRPFWSRFRRRA